MLNLCSWGVASSWSWWRAGPSGRRAGGDRAAAGWRPRRWISSRRNRACSSGKRSLMGGARITCADCGSSENADGGAVQRKLEQQMEVQRHLQLRIEAQGRELNPVACLLQRGLSAFEKIMSDEIVPTANSTWLALRLPPSSPFNIFLRAARN